MHQETWQPILAGIRLVATDMDGTLTQQGQFTPMLLSALEKLAAAGIPVLIVTGRSAGWVQGLVTYLPVAGAIAENGGLFIPPSDQAEPMPLVALPATHRQGLAAMFQQLQRRWPQLQVSTDNRFRITDWTFDVQTLNPDDLDDIGQVCQAAGWGFTYSTVQCHIKPAAQNKAGSLQQVLAQHFPALTSTQVLTVGDSPNDESLFNPDLFPYSVGVANIQPYRDRLRYFPKGVTTAAAAAGFCELCDRLLTAQTLSSPA